MEFRRLHQGLQGAQLSANSGSGGRGHAKDSHAPSRSQRALPLLPARPAERISNQFNAATVCQIHQNRQPVLTAIIDWMIQSAVFQERMFRGASRSVSRRSNVLRNLERGESHTAAGIVNQHGLFFFQTAHGYEQGPSCQVIYRDCGALFEAELLRLFKDLSEGSDDEFGLPAEMRHGDHWFA